LPRENGGGECWDNQFRNRNKMGTTCIITGYKNEVSETFIHAHIECLNGQNVVLYNYYPEYIYNGRVARYFYTQHPAIHKLKKLLPQFLYHRWVTRHEHSGKAIRDFIAGFFKDHDVDVILAEYGFNGADICEDARALNIPLVVHFHGHDAHREPDLAPYKERYRKMFDYAVRIVSVSHFMTDKLIKMGADPARIVYNPYGPREYFYENQSEYPDTILAVGRFADIKAPYLTLMAFKLVLEEIPQAKLVMVGDGPLRETCISLAKTWGIESKISFLGALRHEQTRPLYAQACCFVQHSVTTSYGDAEGTPVAILEAGAAGLAVVSTRHAGIVDEVVHGKTGFLVEERDVVGMKNYLCLLLKDKALCRTLGENAREHIRTQYNLKRHLACLQEVIDSARKKASCS
jgi:colanic acid/amylovoran biosynthesis glycosyltransferase